jgi:hypothetical protein
VKSSRKFQLTFTKPMPTGDGKTVPPTGKSFTLIMCTVGHWKNGVMDEEYLFWDNHSYMKQVGEQTPRPKTILLVSAHWYVAETSVSVMTAPRDR